MAAHDRARGRRHRRMTVKLAVEIEGPGGTQRLAASTLGAGGLFAHTETPPPAGARLCVRLRLPHGARLHVLPARVAWVHPRHGARPPLRVPGMGVEFTDPAACARLARDLERIP